MDSRRTASASEAGQGINLPYAYARNVESSQTDLGAAISAGPDSGGATGARSVERSSLPVFVRLLVAFKLRSLDRQPHEATDSLFELLLLFPVVHHHERVDRLFSPLHGVMVRAEDAGSAGAQQGRLRALANRPANQTTRAARTRPGSP